ncbi:MAG: ABC transporter ATP-binding protein [Gammaproteobacteria bacterium]|uniref:ABC transporter ATP-binding protein n=1 Tax=Candidatus Thiopontia autotrophica TaxID=2841688 RepID=A0A8J6NYY5_9GAMM|nr:ABC transporter ATP-binding protein [Candidatus Thiopontia autotrophica]MBL6969516.1 ABC transporter ATP-binding protein [Gammaproteobacteria bacterium]
MPKSYRQTRKPQKRRRPDVLVRIRDLEFAHESRNGDNLPLFQGINLDIHRGKIVAIMGPSGTGKTTLLRLIGGQLSPLAGTVHVDGKNISELDHNLLYSLRKRMGMLFQSSALLTDMTVFENVAFPLREHADLPESMIHDLVLMKLQAVGLRGAKELMPSELSGGMARRVALARAIALDPIMVMYDEPFTGQDPISMGVLMKLIRELNRTLRLTSIIVSHDVEETMAIADYVYLLAEGRIVGKGSPKQLKQNSSAWIEQFMQGEPDGPLPFHYPTESIEDEMMGSI